MKNKSIKQVHQEIENAKRDALTIDGIVRNERDDNETGGRDRGDFYESGNSLSDIVVAKKNAQQSGKQVVSPEVKKKIEIIFDKQAKQYMTMGLYYAGGFTIDEISDITGERRDSVVRTLKSGVKRLKKYLTESEYDSIRWLVRDLKTIPATPKTNYEGYGTYNAQVGEIKLPKNRTIF